jgi:hypothetical protein
MSIFSRIKDAIFGAHEARGVDQARRETSGSVPVPPAGIPASPADAAWDRKPAPVDVEVQLSALAARNSQQLNWKTSIVDLMKLVGIDSSLENRQSLAQELGYTGDPRDSAKMNVWLHKRVMQELEKNGGTVPASLIA